MIMNGTAYDRSELENGHDLADSGKQPDADHIKMFVGQLPRTFTEEDCRKVFEEFGPIHSINILRDKVSGQGKGCCFVTFFTRKQALDAQSALHNVRTLTGMHNPIQMKPADTENRSERKLFVGMISKKASEEDIRKMFSPHGSMEECTILRDSNGFSRGCAFVTFASRSSAMTAIRVLHHSTTAEGCTSPMVVKMADSSKDKDTRKHSSLMGLASRGSQSSIGGIQQSLSQALNRQYYQALLSQSGGINLANFVAAANPQAGFANLNIVAQLQQLQSLTNPGGMNASVLGNLSGNGMNMGGNDISGSALSSLTALTGGAMYSPSSFLGFTGNQLQAQSQLQQLQSFGQTNNSNNQNLNSSTSSLALKGQNSVMGNALSAYGNAYNSLVGNPYGSSAVSNNCSSYGLDSSCFANLGSLSQATRPTSGNSPGSRQTEGPENSNLFIYHLPPEYGDAELTQLFSNFGTLVSARVFIDKNTGRSKCFGFASYDNPASAQSAIATMNGFQVGAKRLKVQLKRSRDNGRPY